ncbi:MAG: hypothetical protein ACI83D_000685 [Planctomycetota bacterium]|jgi:hypothetical protein
MHIHKRTITIGILALLVLGVGMFLYIKKSRSDIGITPDSTTIDTEDNDLLELVDKALQTNTSIASIPLEKILDGGPGKDGIPALTNPKFVSVKESRKDIDGDVDGMVVTVGDTTKFYPFSIMVWHEIVNDVIDDRSIVVTFCPLCGSSIAFESNTNGEKELFGVSGKLYESNLLMYDQSTESLWSQSTGTAVVGDRTGEKLAIYNSQLMSFDEFKAKWPDGQVLSIDTGHDRNYSFYPYRNYNENEKIYFPISVNDNRLPVKELMYVVNAYGKSVAFPVKQLSDSLESVTVDDRQITATLLDNEIIVTDDTGNILPGYHEMWFSWATQHQDDGIVWQK